MREINRFCHVLWGALRELSTILFLLAGVTLCPGMNGQDDSFVEVRVLAFGDGLFEGLYYKSGDTQNEERSDLKFWPNRRSDAYKVSGNLDLLEFYRDIRHEDAEAIEKLVARVELPNGASRVLLIFFETADFEATGQYEVLALDESPDVWRPGCFRFLNLSGAELVAGFDEVSFRLPHDLSDTFCSSEMGLNASRFVLRVEWFGAQKIAYSTRWRPQPSRARLIVIKPPLAKESLRLRLVNVF